MSNLYLRSSKDGIVYPYSLRDLAKDFPSTCFPPVENLSNDTLEQFGIYPVAMLSKPEDTDSGTYQRGIPVKAADGSWSCEWVAVADDQVTRSIKLDQLIDRVRDRIESEYLAAIESLNGGADIYELMSQPAQLAEVQRLQSNANASVPLITALAAVKGVTKAVYAQQVVTSNQNYNEGFATILALKKNRTKLAKAIIANSDTIEQKVAALKAI